MKTSRQIILYSIVFFFAAGFVGCEDDIESNANDPAIVLTTGGQSIKAPGHGQYKMKVLSGEEAVITVHVPSSQIASLTVTKSVNLEVDPSFGNNGVLTVDPSTFDSEYAFVYAAPAEEVDQLVGFTFTAEKKDGSTEVSDLTLAVTLSPRDNLPTKRWNFAAQVWVDGGNVDDLAECEKDDYFLFNADGTMSQHYGQMTGSPPCEYDGLVPYETWELTEDEKLFIMTKRNIFSNEVTTETYRVVKFTTEDLVLEIDLDLSIFGASKEETFRYSYKAAPK